MQQSQQPSESIKIDSHRIFLIFPLHTGNWEINNLLCDSRRDMINRIATQRNVDIHNEGLADEACLWEPDEFGLHEDFTSRFRQLFTGNADAVIGRYRLGLEGLRALNGSDPSKEALEIVMSGAARERINHTLGGKDNTALWFTINAVRIMWFKFSPVSMLVAELEWRLPNPELAEPIDSVWLIEGLYGLKHNNKIHWSRNRCAGDSVKRLSTEPDAFFTIRELLAGLLKNGSIAQDAHFYTASFLQTNATLSEIASNRLGTRLSLNYSLDYDINSRKTDIITQQQFSNIRHDHGLNGTTTLLSDLGRKPPKSDYLTHYLDNTYRPNYLTMYICLCHEHQTLREFDKLTGIGILDPGGNEQQLKSLRKELLFHRLTYTLNQISQNPLHNRSWAMIEQALGLPELRRDLREQTHEIDAYLQREANEYSSKTMRLPLQVSGGGITALTMFTIIKEFIEAINEKWIGHTVHEYAGILAVAVGLIAGVAAIFYMRRAESQPKAHEIKHHAILENIGASARKN